MTVAKAGKKNIFSGRILELDMGPLEDTMKVEQVSTATTTATPTHHLTSPSRLAPT